MVDATVAQLRDAGAHAIGIALDVTDDAAVEAAVQRTIKEPTACRGGQQRRHQSAQQRRLSD